MRITLDTIRKLPKAELHCHLDGSLRPRTVLELAEDQGVELPTTHLGQLTTLLKQAGRDPGPTDLPWLPGIVQTIDAT